MGSTNLCVIKSYTVAKAAILQIADNNVVFTKK